MSETQLNNQEPATDLPGAVLKRCREQRGISLDDAANATKIGVNYLEALEEDRLHEFASLAYLKGFLRVYANHLGLNPEEMLHRYDQLYAPAGHAAVPDDSAGIEPVAGRGFRWQRLVLPVALLLLMLVAAAMLSRQAENKVVPRQAENPPQALIQPIVSATRQPAPEQKQEPAPIPTMAKPTEVPETEQSVRQLAPEVAKSFVAGMKVTRNGSLSVVIDGASPQNYELNIGDIVEWKAEKSIALELGNGGGVEIELNGNFLTFLVSTGEPTYLVIGTDGIKK